MNTYLVRWLIDIDADNPQEAAAQALICQRDIESTAVVFEVIDHKTKATTLIDLNDHNPTE